MIFDFKTAASGCAAERVERFGMRDLTFQEKLFIQYIKERTWSGRLDLWILMPTRSECFVFPVENMIILVFANLSYLLEVFLSADCSKEFPRRFWIILCLAIYEVSEMRKFRLIGD